MTRHRVTYRVRVYGTRPPPAPVFASMVDDMINAFFEASIHAEPEDRYEDIEVRRSVGVQGPSGTASLCAYVVEHEVEGERRVDAKGLKRMLEDLLGIPQAERSQFDIIAISVETAPRPA